MSNYKIRPHHGLCSYFFIGNGYNREFVENMTLILEKLKENPKITLVETEDVICIACPNNGYSGCACIEKVSRYDRAVLNYLELSFGDSLSFLEFQTKVKQEILEKDRLSMICGDCEWYSICNSFVLSV